ncbi:MAG TPA: hypothetical protein VH951_06865 [Dehalococcoidia bacterium]
MNGVIRDFFEKRKRLIEVLCSTGRSVDEWYETHVDEEPPPLSELATLAGLLAERRNYLDELLQLDDDVLTELVKAHGQAPSP